MMEVEQGGEFRKWVGYIDWRSRPVEKSKHGGMIAAAFVYAAEVFENLAFLANATNLVTYIHQFMHYSLAGSANTVTNFMGTSFLLALLGGFTSDAIMTTYFTVITFVSIELLGLILLLIQAHYPSLKPPGCNMQDPNGHCERAQGGETAMLYIGLYVVALGVGGIKGSLPIHGAEQFDENDPKERRLRSNFFNWFMFSLSTGALIAVTFGVWVEDNKGWEWGFGISTGSILLLLIVFLLGTTKYRNKIPQGSPLTRIAQVFVAAIWKRGIHKRGNRSNVVYEASEREKAIENSVLLPRTEQFRFLDKASMLDPRSGATAITGQESPWRLCTVTQVEEVKIMLRVLPIFASTIMMNCCLAQLQTFSVQQAETMDTTLNGFKIPAASLPVFPVVFMIILIPLYDQVFVPLARRITGYETGITHLQRVGMGLVLSTIAMAVAALVEMKRKSFAIHRGLIDSEKPLPITFLWIGFQYLVLGTADLFTLAGLLEFFFTEAPSSMRSLATALSWTSLSLGYFLSSVLVSIVNSITSHIGNGVGWLSGNNLNRNHLELFYWLLCILSALNFFNYLLWAVWYKYKLPH